MCERGLTGRCSTTPIGRSVNPSMTHKNVFLKGVLSISLVLMMALGSAQAQDSTASNVAEAMEQDGRFGTLLSLIEAAELVETLTGNLTFTVFAPTDDALAAVSEDVRAYLLDNPELLERVLTYHVLPGVYTLDEVLGADTLETLEGGSLTVNPDIRRINGADLAGDALASENGVVFPIDSVMIPEIELPPLDAFLYDDVLTSGSSTVRPLTDRMKDLFTLEGFGGTIVVEETGTNAGLERFCVNAETDIANASRPIRDSEIEACRANGRDPIGFFVAVDALAVVVSRENDFLTNISREQLARVFTGEYTTWDQVDPSYPAEPISTYSPGADSGTFVYFVEAVVEDGLGLEGDAAEAAVLNAETIRFSEDDNVLVGGVETSPYGISYFGYAYYIANQDRLRTVNIDGITPNEGTAESGEYPLSRPLFIYSSPNVMQEKPQVAEFIKFYINNVREQLGIEEGQIGYFPVNQDVLNLDRLEWLATVSE